MRTLARLACSVFGHKWATWHHRQLGVVLRGYERCDRCGECL